MTVRRRILRALPGSTMARTALVLALGTMISLAVAGLHYRVVSAGEQRRLDRDVEITVNSLRSELELAARLVRAVQAMFLASETVEPGEFELLHQGLDIDGVFPALMALAVAAREVDDQGRVRYMTRMISPVSGNERVLGLDVASQPANMRALEDAARSNRPVMSAPFRLVQQEAGSHRGITIRLPLYSTGRSPRDPVEAAERTIGSLAASFDLDQLLMRALPPEVIERHGIQVVDVSNGEDILLTHTPRPSTGAIQLAPTRSQTIKLGGRLWQVRFAAADATASSWLWPLLTLLIGLLASVLMALVVWSLSSTRVRADHLAQRLAGQYRASELRFRAVNELLPAVVAVARIEDGQVEYLNQAGRARLAADDPVGGLHGLLRVTELAGRLQAIAQGGDELRDEIVRIGGDDGFWACLSVSRIELDGEYRLLVVASDVSELKSLTERLHHQATHDELTGLCNRRGFDHALSSALAAVDNGQPQRALIYMDLDQFKVVNESCGHAAGDELLRRLAEQLQSCMGSGDTLARLGGDEFGVVLADGRDASARATAERLRQVIAEFVYRYEGRRYPISASFGMVFIDRPGLGQGELLAMADMLCFLAKEQGRNRVRVSSEVDPQYIRRRMETRWISQVREAMAEGRLGLAFQYLVPLRGRSDASDSHIELLLRMRDEQDQPMSCAEFIPAAERFGLMPQVDRRVVETALDYLDQRYPNGTGLATCAINLSGATVDDEDFADFLIASVQGHGIPPDRLCFEITETAAVGDLRKLRSFMRRLRSLGCRFALDDFGTGMASFGYLRQLPVDMIKIDRSFIRRIDTDALSHSIVRAIVDICHQAGFEVVAEGVETQSALACLQELCVDYVQGYLLHRPEPIEITHVD